MSKMLETFDDISVLGTASSADEGISMVLDKKPDLLFLDISMPGKDGFDLVNANIFTAYRFSLFVQFLERNGFFFFIKLWH